MQKNPEYICWIKDITFDGVPLVGGKNASLGEMYRELMPKGVKIPNGFATTAAAYWHVVNSAAILDKLKRFMTGLEKSDVDNLAFRGKKARELIVAAGTPDDCWSQIKDAYDGLCDEYGPETHPAIRSSATPKNPRVSA